MSVCACLEPAELDPPCLVGARLPQELPRHHFSCRDNADSNGCVGCCVPSRDVRDLSPSPVSLPRGWTWLRLLVQPQFCQLCGALAPSMQRAGGGVRSPLVPRLTVMSRCGTQSHVCGADR